MEIRTDLFLGDSKEVLKKLPCSSVDLIVTSPPYADQKKGIYGGIHPDKYVEWFLPISEQLFRVLKPTATFVLNIKEKVVDGEGSTCFKKMDKKFYYGVTLSGRAFRFNLLFVPHKRIFTSIPNAIAA